MKEDHRNIEGRVCRPFLWATLLLSLALALLILVAGHAGSFHLLRAAHSSVLDGFFRLYTWLGDGLFLLAVCIGLFIARRRKAAALLLLVYAISGVFAQAGKQLWKEPRPVQYFQERSETIRVVEGETLHRYRSFPSGHTTTAFAMAFFMVSYFARRRTWPFYFLAAALVGYSRVYLGQHFPVDVLAGMLIGVLSAWLALRFIWPWLEKKGFWQNLGS